MLAVSTWFADVANAEEFVLSGRIMYEIRDGIYVNRGADDGLRQNMRGNLRFEDGRVFEFEVLNAARTSALLRMLTRPDTREQLVGRMVEIVFQATAAGEQGKGEKGQSPKTTAPGADDKTFVPLPAPPQ